ncbi:hypothetical protein, variant 1 [Aphanomyces invadans]|uniref:FHA domain-containing protein n=1 Tax=Aphanomyces invadans TaxID=157072 RepID=A0A024U6U0_9STRA|nr:hypothetical protein, variant 1 [Aphanomyces invadans]ETW01895.1 hypothetical protein, variant 1 [Aphanomyces invadans]|eukprot:XP_008869743.1 hypothetical protein, variant 1 [Aphanomyces invadans]
MTNVDVRGSSVSVCVSKVRRSVGDYDDAESTPRKTKRLMVVHKPTIAPQKHHAIVAATTVLANKAKSASPPVSTDYDTAAQTTANSTTRATMDATDRRRAVEEWKNRNKACVSTRYTLYLDPDANLTADIRALLKTNQLATFSFGVDNLRSLQLGRDMFGSVDPSLNTRLMGTDHCRFTHEGGVLYIQRRGQGCVSVNGVRLEQRVRVPLRSGDKVTLLDKAIVSLVYVVSRKFCQLQSSRRSLSRHHRMHSIAVCAAAPLVGLDRHGKLHPIPEMEVERHVAMIRQCAARRPSIHVGLYVATWPVLHKILSWGSQVVHFMGQGNHEHVYLEDHLGMVHPLPYVDLYTMLRKTGDDSPKHVKVVVLAYTPSRKLVNAFVALGVPNVLVVNNVDCITPFYTALTAGYTVQESVAKALTAVGYVTPTLPSTVESLSYPSQESPTTPAAVPPLQLFPGGLHDQVIFRPKVGDVSKAPMQATAKSPRTVVGRPLPPLTSTMTCHPAHIFRICELLTSTPRLITIKGPPKTGKAATAILVAHRLEHRHGILGVGERIAFEYVLEVTQRHAAKKTTTVDLWTYVRQRTRTHTTDRSKWPTLIILVGCDAWLQDESVSAGFRALLETWFDSIESLKVLITASTSVTAEHSPGQFGEHAYELDELRPRMAPHDNAVAPEAHAPQPPTPPTKEALNKRFQTLALM